jgi:hypothetical protein
MNETTNAAVQETSSPEAPPPAAEHAERHAAEAAASSVVNTLCDVGATWAQVGIGIGKVALENSARALERTAKLLGDLQGQLKRESKTAN